MSQHRKGKWGKDTLSEQSIITGNINSSDGNRVQAFDRDLPSLERRVESGPQLLGEAITDAEGRFQITYTLEQFRTGEGIAQFRGLREQNADLSFRVFDRTGQELTIRSIAVNALHRTFGPDQIIFNAPTPLEGVSILVDAPQAAGDSEYEHLMALIAPVVADLPLTQLTNEDVGFLINELGLEPQPEPQRIEWLRRSALLAAETESPIEAFYGWGRKNVPAAFDELAGVALANLSSVSEKLLSLTNEERQRTLQEAIAEKIIPAGLRDRFTEIEDEVERLRVERGVDTARRFVGRLVDTATDAPLAGLSVHGFDLDAGAEPKSLGQDVTNHEGLFSMRYVVPGADHDAPPRRLRLEIILDPQAGTRHTTEVQTGADNEALEIRVPLSPPEDQADHRIDQLASTLQIDLSQELRSFLTDKHIATLADIRRAGGLGRLDGLPPAADEQTVRLLDAHADLSRISPDLQANVRLIEKRYDSVLAVARSPRSDFVSGSARTPH
jgi:hypothetical protein